MQRVMPSSYLIPNSKNTDWIPTPQSNIRTQEHGNYLPIITYWQKQGQLHQWRALWNDFYAQLMRINSRVNPIQILATTNYQQFREFINKLITKLVYKLFQRVSNSQTPQSVYQNRFPGKWTAQFQNTSPLWIPLPNLCQENT